MSEDNAPILDSNSELGAHLIFDLLTVFVQIEIENSFFIIMVQEENILSTRLSKWKW